MMIDEILRSAGVLPVLTIRDPSNAVPLVAALANAGLSTVEITLRAPGALSAIEAVAKALPAVVVGAGSVLKDAQMQDAQAAGARFAVSPGLTPALLNTAQRLNLPYLPGVATPSEAMAAHDAGLRTLKLFPAQNLGGTQLLKALAGPLPDLEFCPTGGIDASSFQHYLAEPNVVCVGGSWMVDPDLMAAFDWVGVSRQARARTS